MLLQKKRAITVLAVGLIMALLRSVVIVLNMEKNTSGTDTYYLADSISTTAFTAASILFVVVFAYVAFSISRGKRLELMQASSSISASACMLSFFLLGAVILFAVLHIKASVVPELFDIIIALLSVASAVSFLYTGIQKGIKSSYAFAALFPVVLSAVRMINAFIKTSASPLASSGGYHLLGLAAVMLYFLCEGKAFLGNCNPFLYFLFGNLSIYLLLVYSFPELLMSCTGVKGFDFYSAFAAVDIITAFYIGIRMSNGRLIKKQTADIQ